MSDPITDQLNKLYDSQLASKKEQLTQVYDQNVSNLDAQKEEAAKQTQKNLIRTAVESQQAQKNYAEIQNAYGLSSGAMSQARLAQDNQLQEDLTALRAAQQTADANIERQRTLLAKEYTSAIAEAQAANDLARAEALYAEAKEKEDELTRQQEAAAQLMASVGDFSLYASLYGLTPEQVAALEKAYGGAAGSSGGSSDGGTVASPEKPQSTVQGAANATDTSTPSDTLGKSQMQVVQNIVQSTSDIADKLAGMVNADASGSNANSSGAGTTGSSTGSTSSTTTASKPTYNSIAKDVRSYISAGKSRSLISQYIHSAVSAGYITQNQGQNLLRQYLS